MTAFACSGECGSASMLQGMGTIGLTLTTTYKHQTLGGVGSSYGFRGPWGSPVFANGERYCHLWWIHISNGYSWLKFYRLGAVNASVYFANTGLGSFIVSLFRGDGASLVATSTIPIKDVPHWIAVELLSQDANGIFVVWSDNVELVRYDGVVGADTNYRSLYDLPATPGWDVVTQFATATPAGGTWSATDLGALHALVQFMDSSA